MRSSFVTFVIDISETDIRIGAREDYSMPEAVDLALQSPL